MVEMKSAARFTSRISTSADELRAQFATSGRLLRLNFRAYNEGAAFRYEFPEQPEKEFRFTGEQTEFRLPEGTFGWWLDLQIHSGRSWFDPGRLRSERGHGLGHR